MADRASRSAREAPGSPPGKICADTAIDWYGKEQEDPFLILGGFNGSCQTLLYILVVSRFSLSSFVFSTFLDGWTEVLRTHAEPRGPAVYRL